MLFGSRVRHFLIFHYQQLLFSLQRLLRLLESPPEAGQGLPAASCALPCSISHSLSASCSKSWMSDLAARWWKVSLHRSASPSSWLSRSRNRGWISNVTSHCTGSLFLSPFTTALQRALGEERGEPPAAPISRSWGSQSEEVSVSKVRDGCWAASAERGEEDH